MKYRTDRLVVSQDNYHMATEWVVRTDTVLPPESDPSFLSGVATVLDLNLSDQMGYLHPRRQWSYLVGPPLLR